jgi:hypothetical protein
MTINSVLPLVSTRTLPEPERKASPVGDARLGSSNRSIVKATSAAEKGVPSENDTSLRSLNQIFRP